MKIEFTETVLRDANQSLLATRLPIDCFKSVLSEMNAAGYYSIECWGGATFDACIRYLHEDPWERLKIIKSYMPNTKLQMLLRGQSLLGYKHYSDDVVRKFVFNSIEKGIDIIRIFDALNDLRNIEVAVEEILKCGAHPSCAISYSVSPVHSIEKYLSLAKNMESLGAKSICIKDMSGILSPKVAYELISQLKANIRVPIVLHSHCSTGYAYMTYLKAIEAGVDVIDTAVSSFSGGTSQPATEVIMQIAQDYGREVALNKDKINNINDHFEEVLNECLKSGILDPKVLLTSPRTMENQVPGGMYSNLLSQLKSQNMENRLKEVLEEIRNVRKDLGYPPLVTPISQIVGTQATLNVLTGVRYQNVIEEIKSYFKGKYGNPPGEVNKELMNCLIGREEFPQERYSKKLPKIYESIKKKYEHKGYGRSDILTLILFPDEGFQLIERRDAESKQIYLYSFRKCEDEVDQAHMNQVNNIISDEIRALIVAITAYEIGVNVKDLHINSIYEIEG